MKEVPGEIVGTSLEDEDGIALYEVEILSEDGYLHEVYVDAENGEMLGRETEGGNGFDG